MALESEVRRAARARDQVGEYLDEIENRFTPSYLGGIASSLIRRSAAKHPVAWAVGSAVVVAGVIGLVAWAVLSDDD